MIDLDSVELMEVLEFTITNADPANTLMLNKEQLLKLACWIITYIEEKK